jgi:acyl-CoA synthetase (AMP-forming)/AMP-acid ligase II
VRIIRATQDVIKTADQAIVLPDGEIGEVIVRGAVVSPEYLHRPDANRAGKILDGDGFWHRVGDLGYLDAAGNLYYCGRKGHSVYAGDRAFHSVPLEEIFNKSGRVRRSALVGIRGGQEAAIVVEPYPQYWPDTPEKHEDFVAELRSIAQTTDLTKDIRIFLFHRAFPVDARHNAKIFRDQLADWADRQLTRQKAA